MNLLCIIINMEYLKKFMVRYKIIIWIILLCSIQGLLLYILMRPGFFSPDTLHQYNQMVGTEGLSDWHPVTMALVWRLTQCFGLSISGLLFLQLFLLEFSTALLAWTLYQKYKSRSIVIAILLLPLLPHVLVLSGFIWKDVQMAMALMTSFSLIYYCSVARKVKTKYILYLLAVILLLYAAAVRTNAIAAILPFTVYLLAVKYKAKRYKLIAIITILILLIVSLLLPKIISTMTAAKHGKISNTMKSIDVVNILTPTELASTTIVNQQLKLELQSLQNCSHFGKSLQLEFWNCVNSSTYSDGIIYNESAELDRLWKNTISTKPSRYILFKLEAYLMFLIPETENNTGFLNLSVNSMPNRSWSNNFRYKSVETIIYHITDKLWNKYMPFLFTGWFWLVISIIILFIATRRRQIHLFVLSLSSLLYILSFLPASVTPDYRYVYWPAIACTLAILIVVTSSTLRKTNIAVKGEK